MHIRWVVRRDMPEILAIEEQSFEYPWDDEEFLFCLKQRNNVGLVAEIGEQIVGYILYTLERTHYTILTMAVHPAYRRQGVGRALIQHLRKKLNNTRTKINLKIPETNLPATLFFKGTGFFVTKILNKKRCQHDYFIMNLTA